MSCKSIIRADKLKEAVSLYAAGVPLTRIMRQLKLEAVSRPIFKAQVLLYTQVLSWNEELTDPDHITHVAGQFMPTGFVYADLAELVTCDSLQEVRQCLKDSKNPVVEFITDTKLLDLLEAAKFIQSCEKPSDLVQQALFPPLLDFTDTAVIKLTKAKFAGVYPIGYWYEYNGNTLERLSIPKTAQGSEHIEPSLI